MIALAQVLFKYAFLPAFDIPSQLRGFDFAMLCTAIIFVTAAGNIINDIFDIKADFVNRRSRPLAQQRISIGNAYALYFTLNLLALFLIRNIAFRYQTLNLITIVFAIIVLLYLYSKYFKKIPLFGNILVSILVSLSFLLVIYIEAFALSDQSISNTFRYLILGYAALAFWANFNRELIKDVQDIKGDYAQGITTLPILLGKSRMNILIFISTLFLIFALIIGVKVYIQPNLVFVLYLTFGTCLPLIYGLYHIYQKELKTNYKLLSNLYKSVMLAGILSLILFWT